MSFHRNIWQWRHSSRSREDTDRWSFFSKIARYSDFGSTTPAHSVPSPCYHSLHNIYTSTVMYSKSMDWIHGHARISLESLQFSHSDRDWLLSLHFRHPPIWQSVWKLRTVELRQCGLWKAIRCDRIHINWPKLRWNILQCLKIEFYKKSSSIRLFGSIRHTNWYQSY